MILAGTATQAAARRFRVEGHGAGAWIHPYFGVEREHADGSPRRPADPVPMVYLVDQDPATLIQAHFHQVPQYQVVVRGAGRLGRHPIAPLAAHYAGPFTGYGPIASGDQGLAYLTVRNQWDPGLRALPDARDELDRVPGRVPVHRLADPGPCADAAAALASADAALVTARIELLPEESAASGAAQVLRLAADDAAVEPGHDRADRVWVVLRGAVTLHARTYGPMDCLFLSADESLCAARAGADGADLLVLRFPTVPTPRMLP